MPWPRNGWVPCAANRYPASTRASSRASSASTAPGRSVVRSSVASWWTTTTPSRDTRTSSSIPSAPSASPLSNAAIVFSGASAAPPRCAKTSGRGDSKKGWRTSTQHLSTQHPDRIVSWRTRFEPWVNFGSGVDPRRVRSSRRSATTWSASCRPARSCSPASSATTRRSSRSSSTPSSRGTISSCSDCAARPRAASCAA